MVSAKTGYLLKVAREFHDSLSSYYESQATRTTDVRLQMLFTHLSQQEARVSATLGEFVRNVHSQVLDEWLKYPPELHPPNLKKADPLADPDCTLDDVVLLAQKMDRTLVLLFTDVAQRAVTPEMRDLFESLAELEQMNKAQAASCTTCAG